MPDVAPVAAQLKVAVDVDGHACISIVSCLKPCSEESELLTYESPAFIGIGTEKAMHSLHPRVVAHAAHLTRKSGMLTF